MGPLPILLITHIITIGTILNFNGGNNGHLTKRYMKTDLRSYQ